ncbi:FAA hydrolase family protein [Mesorhizobium waimense]|uniref:FAA hydrolase family protein n=1 Tax=Mesorhizobium waimense TaxID=1300307 RepID=A0A3A5LAY9_9HYPH|nr:fumarylacetoacetate hydrolase family protein [Mesorhizobium waimense]RJT41449.1 FAA hydrolase family protein [Mesorhizobium waimense]
MTDITFKIGTFSTGGRRPFAGLVIGDLVVDVAEALASARRHTGWEPPATPDLGSMDAILGDWERHFEILQTLAGKIAAEGRGGFQDAAHAWADLRVLPPVPHPSKILNSAANYSGHVKEMRSYTTTNNLDPAKAFSGKKDGAEPYLFLKAPSALCGAFDDIVLPSEDDQIDWEAELAVVIGTTGKGIRADRAMNHVAGFMVFNDVSCRNRLFRKDRENFRTDWLSSKSFDTFAPTGPYLVPKAFLPDHSALRITLKVNGELKQDGLAGEMIFGTEEQIEFASARMTLHPGDIFATGTIGGVGQGSSTYLKVGDVIETEIDGLGCQRNPVVGPRS